MSALSGKVRRYSTPILIGLFGGMTTTFGIAGLRSGGGFGPLAFLSFGLTAIVTVVLLAVLPNRNPGVPELREVEFNGRRTAAIVFRYARRRAVALTVPALLFALTGVSFIGLGMTGGAEDVVPQAPETGGNLLLIAVGGMTAAFFGLGALNLIRLATQAERALVTITAGGIRIRASAVAWEDISGITSALDGEIGLELRPGASVSGPRWHCPLSVQPEVLAGSPDLLFRVMRYYLRAPWTRESLAQGEVPFWLQREIPELWT